MNIKQRFILCVTLILFTTLITSCSKNTKPKKEFTTKPVSVKQFDTPAGADPSVTAEMGGNGFTGEGWMTNTNYNLLGNPKAVKGGSITMSIPDFPSTLRTVGKDANSYFNRAAENMIYQGMLDLDPITQEFTPMLATHWKISDDKMKFSFRLNPNARWADGKPVTTEDVIATWKLLVDPGILEAYTNILYQTYEEPVAESKYIVSVKSKQLNWRQFLYFGASMRILPAHYIGGISGKEYLEKFQFDFIPGSGAYMIDNKDIQKGQSVIIRRRSDFWAEKERFSTGLNNFDFIRFDVITDASLEFEKFKKGEIDVVDLSGITRLQNWNERLEIDDVKRGLIQKRKVFNEEPAGIRALCYNMRKPPFDDIRVRLAFTYLFDREKFKDKLYSNAIDLLNSYFENTPNQNPGNPVIKYNYDEAVKLLAEAGWKDKNQDGYLVKDGKILELELPYGAPALEKFLTVYQEDLKKAGVKLNLRQVDASTSFQLGNERNFTILYAAWGGLVFPNPESSFKSNTADEPNTTNWPGVKNARIDQICDEYNKTFDLKQRVKQLREIDSILCSIHPYGLAWYYPSKNLAFQNKFGFPKGYLERTSDYLVIPYLWYNDPEKEALYDEAKKDKNIKMEVGKLDATYWQKIKTKREAAGTGVVNYEDVEE